MVENEDIWLDYNMYVTNSTLRHYYGDNGNL